MLAHNGPTVWAGAVKDSESISQTVVIMVVGIPTDEVAADAPVAEFAAPLTPRVL